MDYQLLGQNIAKTRLANQLTQEQLAEQAEVSTVFISQIETAARKPSLETAVKIADALHTTIDSLLGSPAPDAQFDELRRLLAHKTSAERNFIIKIVRQICLHTSNNSIVTDDDFHNRRWSEQER